MMMKVFTFSTVLFLLAACSSYNQVLKSDDYARKFEMANQLYEQGKYSRCIALYEQVYQRTPKTPEGEVAYYRLGKSYFAIKDWTMASYYLSAFSSRFPFSPNAEETLFLAALCSVQNSPEPSLDQHETELALNDLQQFANRYPESKKIDTCNKVMDQLRYKLQTKEVLNVRLYQKTENFRAATISAEAFLENYPISTYREEVAAILLRNSYKLTINSVETKIRSRIVQTKERYHTFVAEFPNSDYLREFKDYLKKLDGLESGLVQP